MSFEISKILWGLVQPSTLLLLMLAAGFLLLLLRPAGCRRWGRRLLGFAIGVIFLVALLPLERLWLTPLETRFPAPADLPATVDGVILLGGGLSYVLADGAERARVNSAGGERLTAFLALAARYPEARLVFTGGSGLLRRPELREADDAARLLAALGLPPERLLLERESRNTWENAVRTRALVQPQAGERWILVTSAFHMPRAMGSFRAAGWEGLVAYPVDYLTSTRGWLSLEIDPLQGLGALDVAVREWIGLTAYWLLDQTSALLPAP